MICREGTFTGVDRLQLYYQSWDPKQKVKGVVVIVHGLGGHSNKYNNVVNHLVDRGFTLYAFDQRGHGRSPGQRGYISSWAELRTDLDIFLKLIEKETKDYPCFLLGHSLGGALVLDYGLRIKNPQTELQGIIAMAPPLGAVGVPSWRRFIGSVLSRIYPRFSLDLGIDLSYGSRDPQVVEAYKKDTLRHSRGTARLSTEFSKTVAWINSHPQDWQLPLLILYGGEDKVTLPHNNHLFFNGITFADKEIKEYPESYHELQNDLNYQEVLADIEDWLERHL